MSVGGDDRTGGRAVEGITGATTLGGRPRRLGASDEGAEDGGAGGVLSTGAAATGALSFGLFLLPGGRPRRFTATGADVGLTVGLFETPGGRPRRLTTVLFAFDGVAASVTFGLFFEPFGLPILLCWFARFTDGTYGSASCLSRLMHRGWFYGRLSFAVFR